MWSGEVYPCIGLTYFFEAWSLHVCVVHLGAQSCLTAIPWTVARLAPLSMGFPGKNTGVGCHFLLQRIFPTLGSNPHFLFLLHWQTDYH